MDYYNFNPGLADSLAFQKNTRLSNRVLSPSYNRAEDQHYMRNQSSFDQGYQRPSSTSLVLKKTVDREIVEEYYNENIRYRPYPYPKVSKPNQNPKHRPLIRVTVIPNNNTGTQAKLRKRRPSAKKLQSTVSNHESYFTAKNIFLVVGGNKREKIYEIKTTGSEYSNGTRYAKDEDIPVEQNFQQLLSSLNMDKNKKKDKGKGKKDKENKEEESKMYDEPSSNSMVNMMEGSDTTKNSMLRDCIMCSPPIDSMSPRKSRVRITGKIGLTEDDRYVMKCAATIDGKPVETNFFQDQNRSPQIRSPIPEWENQEAREIPRVCMPCTGQRIAICHREKMTQKELPKKSQKDEIIQTNMQYQEQIHPNFPYPAFMTTCPAFVNTYPAFRDEETQCSPQNMNAVCFSNIDKLKIFSSKDEVVQCNCPPDLIVNSKNCFEAEYEKTANTPKSCNSPLVIISVYPKQESDEKFGDETRHIKEVPPAKEKASDYKKTEKAVKKKQGARSRAGSPSPKDRSKLHVEEKKVEKLKGKGKGKDKGDKDKPVKVNKKVAKKEKPVHEENKNSKSPARRHSPTQFGISVGRCAECCMGCVGSRSGQVDRQGGKSNTKRMMNWVSAKNDVSNVAINIDGENEFYDVLFRQSDITTDLQVRKTIKEEQDSQIGLARKTESLENHFAGSTDHIKRERQSSISQTFVFEQPIADKTEIQDQTVSRLHVRDSLEISHRREENNCCDSMTISSTSSTSASAPFINYAPTKHFKGDSCDLSNPVERDKEIRELLGIEKNKPARNYEEFAAKAEVDCECSLHCFYQRQRKKNITAIRNVQELRRLCVDDAVTQASDDDGVDYMDEQFVDVDHKTIGCDRRKDSEVYVAHNQEFSSVYGCTNEDKCANKRVLCDKVSLLKTSSSSTEQNRQSDFYYPGKSTVSHQPRQSSGVPAPSSMAPHHSTQAGKVCTPKHPDREPCGVIIECPYKHSYDVREDSVIEDPEHNHDGRQSYFEHPSMYPDHTSGKICQSKQPGTKPCGIIVQCPYGHTTADNNIENEGTHYRHSSAIENEDTHYRHSSAAYGEPSNIRHQSYSQPCDKMCNLEDDMLEEEKRRSTLHSNSIMPNPPLYQSLIMNRNINIYLEIEQFKKQKPIILSRKQYEKVKRAIEGATGRKNNCICKGQSRQTVSRVSGDRYIQKPNETEKKTEVANKRVQCECDEPTKDKKKRFTWGKNKSKSKKSKDMSEDQVAACCTIRGNVNNDICLVRSKTVIVEESERKQTRISNPFERQQQERISRKQKLSNAERFPDDIEKFDTACCNNVEISKVHENDSEMFIGETRKTRRTKTLFERKETGEHEDNQYRKTQHTTKIDYDGTQKRESKHEEDERKQSRKARQSKNVNNDYEDTQLIDEDQRKQSKKSRHSKNLNDKEKAKKRETRKQSSRISGGGDETLEREESVGQRRSTRKERVSSAPRSPSSQQICCHPVVVAPGENVEILPKKESTIVIMPPPGTQMDEANPTQHNCKRCGRVKQLQSCGHCGRMNKECIHTCYCYEIREENPEPSVKRIFLNEFAQEKLYPASSTEVRYTSVIYANYKHVTFSSTNVADKNVMPSVTNLLTKNYNSNSLHTIFKGRRRTPTPNLGTSAYSLYSDYSDATSIARLGAPQAQALQERKPFLKRLMSCLVMRSKTSNIKIDSKPAPKVASVNSSVDSYHINTSLGAIELSSSIYDTSASFYSNHSVMPISSKIIKRGFLSSVRGFLTNRKT